VVDYLNVVSVVSIQSVLSKTDRGQSCGLETALAIKDVSRLHVHANRSHSSKLVCVCVCVCVFVPLMQQEVMQLISDSLSHILSLYGQSLSLRYKV